MKQTFGPFLCKSALRNAVVFDAQRAETLRARGGQKIETTADLKALTCARCASEWLVRETDVAEQRRCPYCGASLCETKQLTTFYTLGAALSGVLRRDRALLRQPDALGEAMLALSPTLKKDVRIFTRMLSARYVGRAQAILDREDAEEQAAALREALVGEEGLSELWADKICAALDEASALLRHPGTPELVHATVRSLPAPEKKQPAAPEKKQPAAPAKKQATHPRRGPAGKEPPKFQIVDGVLLQYRGADVNVVVPEGVREIARNVFYMCSDLQSVTLPSTLETIGEQAFYACVSLESVRFSSLGLKSIGEAAFFNCGSLKDFLIPASVREIGARAFEYCASLEAVMLPPDLTELRACTFAGCKGLRKAWFQSCKVSVIRSGAFKNCTSLETVLFGRWLKQIEAGVFEHCTGLKTVTVKAMVTKIDPNAFVDVSPEVRYY